MRALHTEGCRTMAWAVTHHAIFPCACACFRSAPKIWSSALDCCGMPDAAACAAPSVTADWLRGEEALGLPSPPSDLRSLLAGKEMRVGHAGSASSRSNSSSAAAWWRLALPGWASEPLASNRSSAGRLPLSGCARSSAAGGAAGGSGAARASICGFSVPFAATVSVGASSTAGGCSCGASNSDAACRAGSAPAVCCPSATTVHAANFSSPNTLRPFSTLAAHRVTKSPGFTSTRSSLARRRPFT
mmetsp:Transcript_14985/g.50548  ORF Transcript_14985/g.50548 Transcript_14985/m.50548 type:complete len:245 (+) Transcript_14985:46-780(+)